MAKRKQSVDELRGKAAGDAGRGAADAGRAKARGPKFGAGHVAAMGRLGLKERRNAVSPGKDSVADAEHGLYGTMTPGEVAQGRGSFGLDAQQEKAGKAGATTDGAAPAGPRDTSARGEAEQARQGTEQSRSRDL